MCLLFTDVCVLALDTCRFLLRYHFNMHIHFLLYFIILTINVDFWFAILVQLIFLLKNLTKLCVVATERSLHCWVTILGNLFMPLCIRRRQCGVETGKAMAGYGRGMVNCSLSVRSLPAQDHSTGMNAASACHITMLTESRLRLLTREHITTVADL